MNSSDKDFLDKNGKAIEFAEILIPLIKLNTMSLLPILNNNNQEEDNKT